MADLIQRADSYLLAADDLPPVDCELLDDAVGQSRSSPGHDDGAITAGHRLDVGRRAGN